MKSSHPDNDLQFKMILLSKTTFLDLNRLGPALLHHQYSFLEVWLLKDVKIFNYITLDFFIKHEVVRKNKFL